MNKGRQIIILLITPPIKIYFLSLSKYHYHFARRPETRVRRKVGIIVFSIAADGRRHAKQGKRSSERNTPKPQDTNDERALAG
jgi:hypothetical protein